jgi:hypothetical protein
VILLFVGLGLLLLIRSRQANASDDLSR